MKVLLLNLPTDLNDVSNYSGVIQPFGLAVMSSFLKNHAVDVTLFDAQAHHLNRREILNYIKELNPGMVGLPLMTSNLPQTIPFLKDVKEMNPQIITVLGGAHPSAAYENLLKNNEEVDIAVIGEGEYTLLELLETIDRGGSLDRVKGIAYREEDQIKVNPFREFIHDLDSLPFGDWGSLPMDNYWDAWTIKKNYVNIILSRGCPFQCTFCGAQNAMGRVLRKRSPRHILEEVQLLHDKYNVRNLLISDSTFNIDNKWVVEICEGLLKMKDPPIWGCNIRADLIDKEMMQLMKRSGCVKLFIGIESADNGMLKNMKKGNTIENIQKGLKIIDECGLTADYGFILGLPGETEESMKRTIAFAKGIKKGICNFTLAAPFPGTEFYATAQKEGFKVENWEKFSMYRLAYVAQGLTKEKLEYYYQNAVRTVHLRPSFLWSELTDIKSWINFKISLRSAYRIFFKRLFTLK